MSEKSFLKRGGAVLSSIDLARISGSEMQYVNVGFHLNRNQLGAGCS